MSQLITIDNVLDIQRELGRSVIVSSGVDNGNTVPRYALIEPLNIGLTNGFSIYVPEGFEWDLSSSPRLFWSIIPPDGNWRLASLIHDALYMDKRFSRKFADDEMLIWSKVLSGTSKKWTLRNFDNWIRYVGVRLFGWWVWYGVWSKIQRFFGLATVILLLSSCYNSESSTIEILTELKYQIKTKADVKMALSSELVEANAPSEVVDRNYNEAKGLYEAYYTIDQRLKSLK